MKDIRTCIGCRTRKKKTELVRIVSTNFIPAVDETQKINSRGIYVCKCTACIEKCLKLLDKNKLNVKLDIDKNKLKDVLKNVEKELGE